MSTRILMACLVALPLFGFSQAAICADNGFYITGSVGSTNVDESSLDDNDISFHPSVGYDFNENWAVQVGYDSFGEPSDSCGTGCTIALDDFWGANVRLVGKLPLNDKWGLFASVGWQHWETDISVDDTTFGLVVDDDDGTPQLITITSQNIKELDALCSQLDDNLSPKGRPLSISASA